jgi:hypothetical protein
VGRRDGDLRRFGGFGRGRDGFMTNAGVTLSSCLCSADVLAAIRRFFLQPQETYSIPELAELWRVSPQDVRDLYHDELSRVAPDGRTSDHIARRDAETASIAFGMLRPFDIEQALGSDFTRVRPEEWRTVSLTIHIPKFITEALAAEAFLPCNLPVDARIEQVLLEVFAPGYRLADVDRKARSGQLA